MTAPPVRSAPGFLARLRGPRLAALALGAILAAALVQWPRQALYWRAEVWPVLRLWPDLAAQYRQQLGVVPYDLLAASAETLPSQAAVLLLTPGRHFRRDDYVVYHRALYFLAPRPVWWAAPVPAGLTWELRWHLPTAFMATAVRDRAAEAGADCLLAWGTAPAGLRGHTVLATDSGALLALGEPAGCSEAMPGNSSGVDPMALQVARALLSALVILALGATALPILVRLGYRPFTGEAAAISWLAGAALASTGMLWLDGLGVGLAGQVRLLALASVPAGAWGLFTWLRWRRAGDKAIEGRSGHNPSGMVAIRRRARLPGAVLAAVIAVQVGAVVVTALGRPLAVWDSWVNWGLKSRLLFAENGITPALYTEPARLIAHPDYPLLMPLLQAWTYAWLGQPDDRWAGLPSVAFYLALLVGLAACLRRLGAEAVTARLAVAACACMPALAGLTASVFPDAALAGLAALSAAYLLVWARRGQAGALLLAALTAGLLSWAKREGLVLALLLAAAAAGLAVAARHPGWPRRALLAAGSFVLCIALIAGPWYAFAAWARLPNPDYGPVTLAAYLGQAQRLAYVAWRGLRIAGGAAMSWVWPASAMAAGFIFVSGGSTRRGLGPAAWVCLGLPLVYLALISQAYVFSAYVPFEQHVVTSLERIVLHVSLLPIVWLALAATGEHG